MYVEVSTHITIIQTLNHYRALKQTRAQRASFRYRLAMEKKTND